MPITVIKVRYESDFYAYRSLWHACSDILRREGARGFVAGYGATAIRDAPYAGLYVLFYEQCKKRLSALAQTTAVVSSAALAPVVVAGAGHAGDRRGRDDDSADGDANVNADTNTKANASMMNATGMKGSTSASINFASGVLAAGLATAMTNPFDAIKTRIQLLPTKYTNTAQAARRMVAEDGLGSLLDGLGLRMAKKAVSSALAWTVYEELIRRAERSWDDEAGREGAAV